MNKPSSEQVIETSIEKSEINEPTTNTIRQLNMYVSSYVQLWIIDSIFEMRSIFKAHTLQLWTTTYTLFGSYLEAYINHHTIRQFLSIRFRYPSTFLSSSTVRVRDAYWLQNADNDFRQVNKHLTSFHFIPLFFSPLIRWSTDSFQSALGCFFSSLK